MTSARPTSWSGWSNPICQLLPSLVSVRKHFESFESFVIQSGDLIREGHHRCGRRRTADVTTAAKLRYPSDLTDDEWAYVEPLIPPAKRGGNKRHVEVREVMNGIM